MKNNTYQIELPSGATLSIASMARPPIGSVSSRLARGCLPLEPGDNREAREKRGKRDNQYMEHELSIWGSGRKMTVLEIFEKACLSATSIRKPLIMVALPCV